MSTPPPADPSTDLHPLWQQPPGFLPTEPELVGLQAWSYADTLRPRCLATIDEVSTEDAERRVILLCPDRMGQPRRTTPGLIAGLQVLAPGESARPHRHTPAALRFHLEGDGAVTLVDGERCEMGPHDLVLTPSMSWHEHESPEATAPVIWLDGIDLPIARAFDTVFFEPAPADFTPSGGPALPRVRFPWAEQQDAIDAAAGSGTGPLTTVEYRVDGQPIMPTIGAWAHRLDAGSSVEIPRSSSSAVHVVVTGGLDVGATGERHRLAPHDIFVAQPWTAMTWATGDEPAYLFSFGDEPALRSLGLFRTERDAAR